MAKLIYTDFNFNKNKIIAAALEGLAAAPASPIAGQMYYDTAVAAVMFRNASTWIAADAAKVPDGHIPNSKLATAPVTGVTGTAPITSSGGLTPAIGISAATTAAAGSMSAADKTKLDGVASGATNTPLSTTAPAAVAATGAVGTGTTAARDDHVHAHGDQAGGTLHAVAVAAGAAGFMTGTDKSKLDGVAAGATANSSDATLLDRANHTGTQTAATISNFDTQVRTSSVAQLAAPAAALAMNSQKITNLGAPTAGTNDAARIVDVESAVQSAAAGIDAKPSVRAATTANIDLALTGLAAIDGVTPVAGDRILVKNQTTASQNGVYIAATGTWARASTENENNEMTPGAFWYVEEGTTNAKTQWRLENTGTITLGTTALTINQFGAANSYTAGNGLLLSGNQFSVDAHTGIVVDANGVSVDPAVVVRKVAAAIGDGTATVFTVTHNLNTQDVTVAVYLNSGSFEEVIADVEHTTVNTVTIRFATAPAASAYRVVVHG